MYCKWVLSGYATVRVRSSTVRGVTDEIAATRLVAHVGSAAKTARLVALVLLRLVRAKAWVFFLFAHARLHTMWSVEHSSSHSCSFSHGGNGDGIMALLFGVRYNVYLRIGLFGGSLRSSNHQPIEPL